MEIKLWVENNNLSRCLTGPEGEGEPERLTDGMIRKIFGNI